MKPTSASIPVVADLISIETLKEGSLRGLLVSGHERRQVRVCVPFAFQHELRLVERFGNGRTGADASIKSTRKLARRLVVDRIGHRDHGRNRIQESVGTIHGIAGGKDKQLRA